MQSARNDFLKRALRGSGSRKIEEEADSVVARASQEAEETLSRLNEAALARARQIILERRARRHAWEALPWWKKPFYPSE